MMKNLKKFSVILIIFGIIACIGGIGFAELAEDSRGVQAPPSYMKDGAYVANDLGVIGANKANEEKYENMSAVFCVLGGVLLLFGVVGAAGALKIKNTPVVKKSGTILEKENGAYDSVIVEFDDNSRKKLTVEQQVIVAKGDRGIIGYKNNLLVEFEKEL